jgi:hypothetical protein
VISKGAEESQTYWISPTKSCQNFSAQAGKYRKMPERVKKTEGGGPPALSKERERRAVFLWPFQPMFYYLKDISPGSVHQYPVFF